MNMIMARIAFAVLVALVASPLASSALADTALPLKVSGDKRRLVVADGVDFFWLADTAWELFHRLNREEAEHYLDVRQRQGFNVIQAVALAELDGIRAPNAYGHVPLIEADPERPAIEDGPANDYWDHVDFIVDAANKRGMRVGLLPTWGSYWTGEVEGVPAFNRRSAEIYGEFLGRRYRQCGVVWILGGDRLIENEEQKEIVRAMARGLRAGDGGTHLITFHPRGFHGSSEYFHNESWLDFNMRQNTHVANYDSYANTRRDYDLSPPKPVIDGEPLYEGHPVHKPGAPGISSAVDVRRAMYWDLFAGACGHTYGHHSVWQMWTPGRAPRNGPPMSWRDALEQPGAQQMQFGRRLIESRPASGRIPDDDIILGVDIAANDPAAARHRFVGTRDEGGQYAMAYAPTGRKFRVRMNCTSGQEANAWWYNPRSGEATLIGRFATRGEREFTPPELEEESDWVLVLDDPQRQFIPPGAIAAAENRRDSTSQTP